MQLLEFDALYARRHETEALEKCSTFISEQTLSEYQWQWRAGRLAHFQAMQSLESEDKTQAREHFKRGEQYAAQAEAQASDLVEGLFWRATCELERAQLEGPLAVALVLSGAQKRLDRAARIDEGYHYAGPLRVQGRVTHLKPLVLGGSLDRSIAFYRRALQLAPDNSTTLLYLSDALRTDRQVALARQTLKQLIALPLTSDWVWETERDKRIAQGWLQSRFD